MTKVANNNTTYGKKAKIARKILKILEIGCSGIFGILITIAYQHYNQQQNQIQDEIIVNIDGQEISYNAKDITELNKTISDLKFQNTKLESKNNSLEDEINNFQSKNKQDDREDYLLIVNGIEKDIDYERSIVLSGEHSYIRDDIVKEFYSNVSIDYENKEIIVGNKLGEACLLMKTCQPYQTADKQFYQEPDRFIMSGDAYTNGFTMHDGSFAIFNLEGKYISLNFVLGHIDDTTMLDGTFYIYLDEELAKVLEVGSDDIPKTYNIPLNNAKKLKIEKVDKSQTVQMGEWYGFGDIILQ